VADDYAARRRPRAVNVGGSVTGNIETTGDADWFAVTLAAGTTYRFDLEGSNTGQGTLQFPLLQLRDPSGNLLLSDSLSGPSGSGPAGLEFASHLHGLNQRDLLSRQRSERQ